MSALVFLARFQHFDLHDAAIVTQRPRHAGEHLALVALDIDLDCEGLAGERHKIIEAHDLDVITLSLAVLRGFDDLGEADIAFRPGHEPKSPGLGAERQRMDFQIGSSKPLIRRLAPR